MGKNGKKLRYFFDKDNKTIVLKVPSNWTKNARYDITDKYDAFAVNEDVVKKRGRPKKEQRKDKPDTKLSSLNNEENDFNIGDRVKKCDNLMGVGTIIIPKSLILVVLKRHVEERQKKSYLSIKKRIKR